MKICFAASSGGHLEELSQLSELAREEDFILTEKTNFSAIKWCKKIFFVSQINRREVCFLLKFIYLLIQSLLLLQMEKPDIIISTGALATFPICLWGKIFKKKIIYIESFARVDSASLTGRLMYKIADIFIVQWKEMLTVYPNSIYGGGIF